MGKWILRAVLVGVVGFVGYAAFDSYRGGFFNLPDLPHGAYPISFTNGFRAIVLDDEVSAPHMEDAPKFFRRLTSANPDRRYLGVPFEVARWLEGAWSWCSVPTPEEADEIFNSLPENLKRDMQYARLDGFCEIHVDGEKVPRGLIYSVPAL
ncbi:MAG: hypothetical protein ACWA5A_05945 [Marinibacterium sp.]